MTEPPISRRSVLRGALVTAAAGVAGYLVAAHSSTARAGRGLTVANAYGPSPPSSGRLLAQVGQIPLGGGVVLASAEIVLTRSQAGAVRGFSAICTHQGCTVGSVHGGVISCPCHGSRFDAQSGAVITGPATSPLPGVSVVVRDGGVYSQ